MRLETTDGKRIVATTEIETSAPASYRFALDLPDGSTLHVSGAVDANAHLCRDAFRAAADELLGGMVDAGWFPGGLRAIPQPPDGYTMALQLCDANGVADLGTHNRLCALGGREPYTGAPFACTGHAHLAGEHILCTSVAHRAAPASLPLTATATTATTGTTCGC